jgi:hypothetical protein
MASWVSAASRASPAKLAASVPKAFVVTTEIEVKRAIEASQERKAIKVTREMRAQSASLAIKVPPGPMDNKVQRVLLVQSVNVANPARRVIEERRAREVRRETKAKMEREAKTVSEARWALQAKTVRMESRAKRVRVGS